MSEDQHLRTNFLDTSLSSDNEVKRWRDQKLKRLEQFATDLSVSNQSESLHSLAEADSLYKPALNQRALPAVEGRLLLN